MDCTELRAKLVELTDERDQDKQDLTQVTNQEEINRLKAMIVDLDNQITQLNSQFDAQWCLIPRNSRKKYLK